MTKRTTLGLIVLAALLGLWLLLPPPAGEASPWSWRWEESPAAPFDTVPSAPEDRPVAVRVLEGPGAAWTAELLWSAGVLDLAPGPPAAHPRSSEEVWLLFGESCPALEPVLEHIDSGGGLVAGPGCTELLEGLGLPSPAGEAPLGAVADVQLAGGRGQTDLPVDEGTPSWAPADVEGWEAAASLRSGEALALVRENVAVFSFDVPRWVRRLRQGEPSLGGVDRDGLHGLKPNDLRPFPWPEATWRLPGGELWVELLVALAGDPARIWPLPSEARSALVMTLDQDFAPAGWIEPLLSRTEERGGEASLMLTWGTRQTNTAPAEAAGGELLDSRSLDYALAWGHGFGAHPNGAGLQSVSEIEEALRLQHGRLVDLSQLPPPRTVRNHYLLWWEHEAPALLQAELGLWMGLDYVSIAPDFRGPGFGFGSARPARWGSASGAPLALLSQPTHIEDDVLMGTYPYSQKLSSEEALRLSGELLAEAMRHAVPVVANVHPMLAVGDDAVFLEGLLAAASERGLPILSAERHAAHSWARLAVLTGGEAPGVPLLRWTAGADCSSPVSPSVLAPPGCLEPLQQ